MINTLRDHTLDFRIKEHAKTAGHMTLYYSFASIVNMMGAHLFFPLSWGCQIAEFPVRSVAVDSEQQKDDIKRGEY